MADRVRPKPDLWQNLQDKYQKYCQYWLVQSSSSCLIGLLTATGKQVHLGPFHMRPIQWHLTNIWRVPESLEMLIPIPRSLHPHLQWWLQEDNVLAGQSLHPSKTSANVNRCIKRRVGAHLNEHTTRGTWSPPESKCISIT